jgi:cation diffusion facilitator CzcD-associated flavoprotein CzcO
MSGFGRAVVIGAGFAGLAAARVLSEHCERVVVLDRDDVRSRSPEARLHCDASRD